MPNYSKKENYPDVQSVLAGFSTNQEHWFTSVSRRLAIEDEQRGARLRCMFGLEASTNDWIGSNGVERSAMIEPLASQLMDVVNRENGVIARVIISCADWRASSTQPELDLVSVRRVTTALKRLAPSSMAAIQIGCVPVGRDGTDFEFVARASALLVGKDLRAVVPVAAAKLHTKYRAPAYVDQPFKFTWPSNVNQRVITALVAKMLDMDDPLETVSGTKLKAEGQGKWNKQMKRRAVERFKLLSLARMDRLLIATGGLEPVLAAVRAGALTRVRKSYQQSDKPLHRDQIVHFWAEGAVGTNGKPLILPFVKQR